MSAGQFTLLLKDWSKGDSAALDALTPIVYQELRRLAGARLKDERSEHTLQPIALIHEAYLKLVGTISKSGTAVPIFSPWPAKSCARS